MEEKNKEKLNLEICNNIKEIINLRFKDKDENEEIEVVFCLKRENQKQEKILDVSNKILNDVEQYSSRIFEIKSYFERLKAIYRLFVAELDDFNKTLKPSPIDNNREVELVTANRHFLNLISNGPAYT
ncbi:hypothetical protein BI362_11870 [Streptococcus parauberis]|nr:hypothetical protein BI362_11860 [Streptococcus parauberis]OHY29168.1 hypothetical protein BI362_11870 [Streptococcus parauberis]